MVAPSLPTQQLTIYMTEAAKRRLDLYISECPSEISGVGEVSLVPGSSGSDLVITGVFLLDQVASAADTELTSSGLAAFLAERATSGQSADTIRLWWHSHADTPGALFWSRTDEAAVSSFSYAGWFVSVVGNRRGELLGRLDIYPSGSQPLRHTFHQVQLVELARVEEERAAIRAEIARKVRPAPRAAAVAARPRERSA
jgi:hypothetical protein